jgi:hypothetical protein
MIRPDNYYVSLDSRISGAIAHTADPRQLWLLIAETELALAAAPDPASLRAALAQLKQTHY